MRLFLIGFLYLFSMVAAQDCLGELQGGLSSDQLAAVATGEDAATMLYRAVSLLEPDLPKLYATPSQLPVDALHSAYAPVKQLLEWGLLPDEWQPENLEPSVWQAMLNDLRAWYDLAPLTLSEPLTLENLLSALDELIRVVAPTLKPVALVASEANGNGVAFWAMIRNDSVYPRMIVMRPPDSGVSVEGGVRSVLPFMGNCVHSLSNYIYASADTARNLFLSHNTSRMYVVGSTPQAFDSFVLVPEGEETAYLTFIDGEVDALESYSVVFAGRGTNPIKIMGLLPRVRTNMSPAEVISFLTGG